MPKKNLILGMLLFFLTLFNIIGISEAADKGKLRFAVIGCLHLDLSDPREYKTVVREIKKYKPDFVLMLGGMIEIAQGKSPEVLWKTFDRINAELKVPVYNVQSHCRLMPVSDSLLIASMEKCFLERYKSRYYSIDYRDNLFILLDSESLFASNQKDDVDKEQIAFLKNALSGASKYNHVFVALNQSFWFEGENEKKWFEFMQPVVNKKVNYVFGAGRHFLKSENIGEVNYVTSGSPKVKTAKNNVFLPHFLLVDIIAGKVDMKVVPLAPFPLSFFKSDKDTEKTKGYSAYYYAQKVFKPDILNSQERIAILEPERIIETLQIKPDMNIVDVGAGTGLFTFPIADRLKGTGKVFATDIDSTAIEYLNAFVKKGRYKNVVPVQVTSKGLDNFYKKNSFDIIFLCNVYDSILNPQEYFRELRPSLQKNKGSLYIIHFKNISDFSEVEFGDFKKVARVLKIEGSKSPIYKRLNSQAQGFINEWSGQDVPAAIRKGIIQDLNKMLLDRFLMVELLGYYGGQESGRKRSFEELVYPYDVRLALWLYASLDGKGIFEPKEMIISEQDRRELKKLNRILIAGIFQSDTLFWITTRRPIVNRESIIATLEAAGYKLVQSHDFLAQYDFLEFK